MLDQLSKPYKIALGAFVVLVVAWFTVLKPGDPVEPAASAATVAQAPGVQGLTNAVTRARGAATAAAGANAATDAAVSGASGDAQATTPRAASSARTTGASRSKAAKAAKSAPGAGRAASVLAALDRGDVAVLSFLQPGGADDALVRRAVRGLRGPVRTFTADIASVGDYGAILGGVPVSQAPATLVIGADRSARFVDGLTTRGELQQLVDDQAER